jgi:hypothetical protein
MFSPNKRLDKEILSPPFLKGDLGVNIVHLSGSFLRNWWAVPTLHYEPWFPSSCSEKLLSMWDTSPLAAGSRAAGGGGATFS